jgi:hypothetical protein
MCARARGFWRAGRYCGGAGEWLQRAPIAMAGLDPAIHAFLCVGEKDVDARVEPGHDGVHGCRRSLPLLLFRRLWLGCRRGPFRGRRGLVLQGRLTRAGRIRLLRLLLRLTLLLLLLSRLIRRTGLHGLTSAIRRAGRLRRARPLLQIILPLVGLSWRVVAVRLRSPQRALFGHNLAACDLRGMHLAHDTLVARGLLRRDR